MGIYSKALYELIQSVAYSLDDCRVGTAETNSNTVNLVCSYLKEGADHYNGWDCHIYSGTAVGQTREVSDFDATNTIIVVAPAFANALTTNSKFELHKMFKWEQYKDAVNRSIEVGKKQYTLEKIDETVDLETDVYEYSIPLGFKYITGIWLEDKNTADTWYQGGWIDPNHYSVIPGSLLKFHDDTFGIDASKNGLLLRIMGYSMQASLTNDADTCEIPPEFIIEQAKALLLDTIVGKESQADRAQAKAEAIRRRMSIPLPPMAKAVYEG